MNYKIKIMTRTAAGDKHEWGCLMMDFPEDISKRVQKWAKDNIKDENLYKEDGHGLETKTHVTVAYGIALKTDRDDIKKFSESVNSPVKVKLAKITKFDTNEKFDVIKVDVESEDLHKLHEKLEKEVGLPGNTFPDYKPHLTLAYVKKGTEDDLVGKDPFAGEEFELTTFDYSCPLSEGEPDTYTQYEIKEKKESSTNYRTKIYSKLVKAGPTLDRPHFDFALYQIKARGMTNGELYGAIKDINETLQMFARERAAGHPHGEEGWYSDEKSVYVQELNRRGKK